LEIRVAHCADLHIGSPCSGIGTKGEIRRHELKTAFFRILDLCGAERINLLLISGDLFDDVNLSPVDVQDVKNAISKVNLKVVISPGNHDPFTPDSPYNSQWPENAIIFKNGSEAECVKLDDLNVRLWGYAFKGMYEKENFLKNLNIKKDDNFIDICVMHGDVSSSGESMYCPVRICDIEASGMDYIALGHIHKRSDICRAGSTFYAYPGCPEGRGFDETGDKGIYIGAISKGCCNLKFKKICKRAYEQLSVDISDASTENEILNLILEKAEKVHADSCSENLYSIILTGSVSEDFFIDALKLETELSEKLFFAKITDDTETEINTEKLKFRNDFKSIFIRKMLLKIESSKNEHEKAINKKALKTGLRAFCGDVKYRGD
jgi:DNA repair exonuclease SbcCD nuclease subunit